ncbi:MAG: phage major capsid protein [Alphaproteobacteria bacterium]
MRDVDFARKLDEIDARTAAFSKDGREALKRAEEEIGAMRERLEELEARGSSPKRNSAGGVDSPEDREHLKRFTAWLRKPRDANAMASLGEFEQRTDRRDVTVGAGAGGGFAVPETILRDIEKLELKFSPLRSLVRVQQVASGDAKQIVDIGGSSSGWAGETDTRNETATSALRELTPTWGELFAYPKASEWSLDDMFFNVGQWLAESAADAFAIAEADAVIRGNGTKKPTGWLNTTPTTAADFASPLRAAAAYQYIACLSTSSPKVAEVLADPLINLLFSVNSRYRTNGTWAMNSATAGAISKLKDGQGRFLWAQSLAAGQPDRLLGYPVSILEGMDDIGTNKFPVAFGDFRRAYTLFDRVGLRITPDPYTTAGFTKFYIRRRVGGIPANNDALKFLKTTIA